MENERKKIVCGQLVEILENVDRNCYFPRFFLSFVAIRTPTNKNDAEIDEKQSKNNLEILTASRRRLSCSCRRSSARLAAARSFGDGEPLLPCGDCFISSTRPSIWSIGWRLTNHKYKKQSNV